MEIIKPLRNPEFRFIKVNEKTKAPIEPNWQKDKNYSYDDPEFKEYAKTAKALGIATGFNELAVVDIDKPEIFQQIKSKLPETLTAQTGSGGYHLYYKIPDLEKKIILKKSGVHYGEVQFKGQQVIIPNSLHPSGKTYHLIIDKTIKEISSRELLEAINPFIEPDEVPTNSDHTYDIGLVASHIKGLVSKGNLLVGPHPVHGSDGGKNIEIDLQKNLWHCYRCETGGDALYLVAVLEGILSCEDCKGGTLTGDNFKKTLKAAQEKYKLPVKIYVEKDEDNFTRPLLASEKKELESPDLLANILKETAKEGLVGEQKSQLVLILKIALRLVRNAAKTSSNIIVSDTTGGGKDHLCMRVCDVMLEKEKTLFHETMISEKVLNYWEPAGEGSNWNGRVMYLEDPLENTLASQAFRVRASGNNKQTNLDTERNVIRIEIKGKPVLIVTSMKHSIDIEGCRRWDAVRVDTSSELTRAVREYEYKKAAGLIKVIPNDNLRNGLRNLPRVTVTIPFALEFLDYMPDELIMRSQNHKFLDYIKASAALHQFQRERNADGEVIATWDDYDYAIRVFNILKNRQGEALNRQEEALLNYLKEQPEAVKLDTIVTNVRHISKKWLLDKKDNLVERGLLEAQMLYDIDARREVEHLSISSEMPTESEVPVLKKSTYLQRVVEDINKTRKAFNLKKIVL